MSRDWYAGAPEHLRRWLDQLTFVERLVWKTAIFGGARPGELPPLRLPGQIEGKSDAGRRTVPFAGPLREELERHRAASDRSSDDLALRLPDGDARARRDGSMQ